MNYIKYLQNAGTITYANESRMPDYSPGHWYGGLVSGINGSRYSVHPGVYNFYTNEDGSISWGKRTGHIVKGSDGKLYVDFEVDPNLTARPELKTYLRFELGLTALKPQTPIVELTTEQEIIDPTLRKVSTSVPILNLASLDNQVGIEPLKQPALPLQVSPSKPIAPKSNTIIKLPVPLNLLPYIANVTSDGIAFFNIPDGYTQGLFEEAIDAVYLLNKELSKRPMVYYEQPQLLILQQKLQLLAVLLSLELYLSQRLYILQLLYILLSWKQKLLADKRLDMKYNADNNAQKDKRLDKKPGEQDLVAEVFAYPSRYVDVYSIHPEAYLKALEYLNKNYLKTKTDNKPAKYVLSLYGFDKVPIGGEVNDSTFHYINKDGKDYFTQRYHYNNANIINKNEFIQFDDINNDNKIVTKNGKLKLYSNLNNDDVYYKNSEDSLIIHPFNWYTYEEVGDNLYIDFSNSPSYLIDDGLTLLQAIDYINKNKNYLKNRLDYNVIKSIFRPIEKLQTTKNNSTLQVKGSDNIVLKAKQKVKKVLSFLGFLNGGTLNYLNYIN